LTSQRGREPDSTSAFLDEVRHLAEKHDADELTRELDAIAEEIDGWCREYGVGSLSKLRQSVGRNDLTESERSERLDAIAEWEYDIEIREAIRLAINLQDSMATLEPLTGSNETVAEHG